MLRADGEFVQDDPRYVPCHLHRRGRHPRHRFTPFVEHEGHVADGKNFRMARQAQVWIHFYAAGAVEIHAEFLRQRAGGHARGPDDVFRVEDLAVLEFDPASGDVLHPGVCAHFDAHQF